jgi:hypothetical protein
MFWKWKLLLGLVLFKLQSFKFSFKQFGLHLTTTWDAFDSPNAKHCLIYLPDINLWGVFKGNFAASFLAYDHALHIRFIWLKNRQNLNPAIEQREKNLNPYNKVEDQIYKSLMYTKPQSCMGGKTTWPFGCACLYYPLHHRYLLVTIFGLA